MFAVYALCYGDRTGRRGEHFLGYDAESAAPHPTAYYCWLAISDQHTVVVDTGIRAARARDLAGLDYREPGRLLAALGVRPDAVDCVVLTHLHYDHAGTASTFTAAEFVLQRSEMDYWTGPTAKRIQRERWLVDEVELDRLTAARESGRVRLIDGDAEIVPGLGVHLVGGHTAGMQVVRIETRRGALVLASDSGHFYENLQTDRPAPLLHSMPDVYAAFDRVNELADGPALVVPGHDPEVLARHQAVADRIVRMA